MKLFLSFFLIFISFAISSCSKEDNKNDASAPLSGKWFIQYYWDEKDETVDFSGYIFEFLTNGEVTATNPAGTVTGTWQETSNKFNLNFGSNPVLQELNNDWLKIDRTSSFLHLEEDNPAQDDELHFKRL